MLLVSQLWQDVLNMRYKCSTVCLYVYVYFLVYVCVFTFCPRSRMTLIVPLSCVMGECRREWLCVRASDSSYEGTSATEEPNGRWSGWLKCVMLPMKEGRWIKKRRSTCSFGWKYQSEFLTFLTPQGLIELHICSEVVVDGVWPGTLHDQETAG